MNGIPTIVGTYIRVSVRQEAASEREPQQVLPEPEWPEE
jgi:hypothetical protein